MAIMDTYETLSPGERYAIEKALDKLSDELRGIGAEVANDDRAARAAEALAKYVVESRS